MKNQTIVRVIGLFLITLVSCLLVSCMVNDIDDDTTLQEHHDKIIVEDVSEDYIVGISEYYNAKVSIPNWFANEVVIMVGQTINISHNGNIQETYPAQYNKIYSMSYQKQDGELITKYPAPENIAVNPQDPDLTLQSHIAYIEFYSGDTCIQEYVSDDDAKTLFDNLQNMKDGTDFIYNCLPDYTIVVDGNEYVYCSRTGIVVDMQLLRYFIINDKNTVNNIIETYGVDNI